MPVFLTKNWYQKSPFTGARISMAEERGFEPLLGLRLLSVFETDPFSRLGIPPPKIIAQMNWDYLQKI